MYTKPVKAGIPENVEAEVEKEIDLNEILVKNAANTFLVKVNGSSMIDAGIREGDLLVVDRSIEPVNNNTKA